MGRKDKHHKKRSSQTSAKNKPLGGEDSVNLPVIEPTVVPGWRAPAFFLDPTSPTFLADMLIESIPEHERNIQALQLKMAGQSTVDPKLLEELESEIELLDMCQQAKDYFANPDPL